MDFQKQRILRLEATTHRRRNDLRRAFNQALVAGGKRPMDESSKSMALAVKRQKIDPNLFNLPEAVQISILKQNSCQDTMNFFNSQKRLPTFSKEQWEALTASIDCEAFDKLKLVKTVTADEGEYTRVDFYRNGEVDAGCGTPRTTLDQVPVSPPLQHVRRRWYEAKMVQCASRMVGTRRKE